jgi:hypothetical protein
VPRLVRFHRIVNVLVVRVVKNQIIMITIKITVGLVPNNDAPAMYTIERGSVKIDLLFLSTQVLIVLCVVLCHLMIASAQFDFGDFLAPAQQQPSNRDPRENRGEYRNKILEGPSEAGGCHINDPYNNDL